MGKSKHLFIIAIALTAGCSVDDRVYCDAVYTYTEPQTDTSGIVLEPSGEMHVDFETVSRLYQETQACMGMTAPPPTVEYVSMTEKGRWGVYIVPAEVVWINTNIVETITRNCASDTETLKHEFVHHILYKNGAEWQSHENPLWETCGLGLGLLDGVPFSM